MPVGFPLRCGAHGTDLGVGTGGIQPFVSLGGNLQHLLGETALAGIGGLAGCGAIGSGDQLPFVPEVFSLGTDHHAAGGAFAFLCAIRLPVGGVSLGLSLHGGAGLAGFCGGTGRRLPAVSFGLAGGDAAGVTGLGVGAGSCLPIVPQGVAVGEPADTADGRLGTGGLLHAVVGDKVVADTASEAGFGFVAVRGVPIVAQRLPLGDPAEYAGFGPKAVGGEPGMIGGDPLCLAAKTADGRLIAGGGLPIVAVHVSFRLAVFADIGLEADALFPGVSLGSNVLLLLQDHATIGIGALLPGGKARDLTAGRHGGNDDGLGMLAGVGVDDMKLGIFQTVVGAANFHFAPLRRGSVEIYVRRIKAAIAIEGAVAHGLQGGGQMDLFQIFASFKGVLVDCGHSLGDGHGGQAGAGESVCGDRLDTAGNGNAFQTLGIIEGAKTQKGKPFRQGHRLQGFAVGKYVVLKLGNGGGDVHTLQLFTAGKGSRAKVGNAVGDHCGLQPGVAEGFISDLRHGRGEVDDLQLGAIGKAVATQPADPFAQGHGGELVTAVEGVLKIVGHRAGDINGLQKIALLKGVASQVGHGFGDVHRMQARAGEGIDVDDGKAFGQMDGGKGGTTLEGSAVDLLHTLAHFHSAQRSTIRKGVHTDLLDGIANGDRLQVPKSLKTVGANVEQLSREGHGGDLSAVLAPGGAAKGGVNVHFTGAGDQQLAVFIQAPLHVGASVFAAVAFGDIGSVGILGDIGILSARSLGVTGHDMGGALHLLYGEDPSPMDGIVVGALGDLHVILKNPQNDHGMGVVIHAEDITGTDVLKLHVKALPCGEIPKGGVAEHKGEGNAAGAGGVDPALPGVILFIPPGRSLGVLGFQGHHGVVSLRLRGSGSACGDTEGKDHQHRKKNGKQFFHNEGFLSVS